MAKDHEFETRAIHSGQGADPATGATITPVYQTVTYTQDEVLELFGCDDPKVRRFFESGPDR